MKRILLWAILLAVPVVLGLLPLRGTDVGDLEPARLLLIDKAENGVRIESDTGAVGTGETPELALADLEETAEGTLFLQTVQTLVFSRAALSALPEAAQSQKLRPAARVYAADGLLPEAKAAAVFKFSDSFMRMLLSDFENALRGAWPSLTFPKSLIAFLCPLKVLSIAPIW